MSHRNRPRRLPEPERRPLAGLRRAPEPFVVELAANAQPAVLAAVEAAILAVVPLATVELVRVDAMTLSKGDMIRLRSPSIAWNAPASVWRRHDQAMVAFAAAFDANLAPVQIQGPKTGATGSDRARYAAGRHTAASHGGGGS